MPQQQFYQFGPYRIDLGLSRLERDGRPIPLAPKAFDLLLVLARNQHRIVSKAELMETLWSQTFVEEGNLAQHVYTLRKALGDQPTGEPYIETIPRRGYRLAAEVREVRTDTRGDAAPAAPPPSGGVSPQPVFEGERRRVTVLHCAIADAAGVAERLGSAAMRELARRLLDLAAGEVDRQDGAIVQRSAAGFAAAFGVRVVNEDDARRAVVVAQALRLRLTQLDVAAAPGTHEVELQVGIATGPLVVSRVSGDGRVEYEAVGDAIHRADALRQLAEPGAILIDAATRRAIERYARVEPLPSTAGLSVYRVLNLSRAPAAISRSERPLASFVGRDREMAMLHDLLAPPLAGRGQVVSIVGEPGMGKSRLVYEFTRVPAGHRDGPLPLEGRCLSFGSTVPYLPVADLVRAYCGAADADVPATIRRAADRALRPLELPDEDHRWLLRLLGADGDADGLGTLSPEAVKARTFDALRRLFLGAAARRPLVLVVEDVHWIDRTSEEFLASLVERLAGARVLLVTTHRPGYRAPWMTRSYATQITLGPLSAAASARLVESVVREQAIAPVMSDAILRRGEGNPFFLEELARSAVEQASSEDAIPATVHGVIMARVDRLSEASRRLLQTASVVGREVSLRVLRRLCGDIGALDGQLGELCRLEFFYERPGGEDPLYVFKHALTQDVAYDSLLARRRRELHLEVARAFEALHTDRLDDIAATLAHHYVRTELIDEAVTWLVRAADRAARVYANAEVILHLDLAARRLQRLPEGPGRDRRMLDVALRHAHSLYFLGRFRESVDVLRPHAARLGRLGDAALSAAFAFWLAHMYSRLGDQRGAAASAQHAIESASAVEDRATLGKAHGLLALEGHWAGRPKEGIAHGAKAIRLLKPLKDQQWWLGMAHFYVAVNHLLAGDFGRALAEAARADAVGRGIGDPRLQTYAGYTTGWIEACRGDHDRAIVACERSLQQAPDRVSRTYAALFLGYALVEQGDCDRANALLGPVAAELEGFEFPQWHALALVLAGESCRGLGRPDEAMTLVGRGLEVATRAEYWYAVGLAQRIAGRLASDRGDAGSARRAFDDSLATFERIGAAFEAARSRQDLATLAAAP